MTDDTDVNALSYEAAMAELENVVSQLENASVPLDESIRLYERGEKLKKHCEAKLSQAEEKVAQITSGAPGQADGLKPLDQ